MPKDYFTTHDVSRILKVDFTTVIDWCDQGKLLCYRTPGGHRRVRPQDLFAFMRKFGFPMTDEVAAQSPIKILIVDDEDSVRATVSRMIKSSLPDAEVDSAKDGFEAGKKTALLRPDLLVLDVNLPGLDGYSVCQLIRGDTLTSHARILAMSGNPDPETRTKILSAGADDFLPKPFDMDSLVSKVKTLLRRPAVEAKR